MTPNTPAQPLLKAIFTPDAFDFWSRKIHPLWSWQQPLAQIAARHAESSDSVTLVLQPNRHVSRFLPGQHLNVSVEIDGRRLTRSYSPRHLADGRLAITVKRVADSDAAGSPRSVSRWLCDTARVGDTLLLTAPYGDMTLSERPAHAVLLAAGSGITPFMSLIQTHAASGQRITLLYWARDAASCCFAEALQALADTHETLVVHILLTRPAAGNAAARLHAEQVSELVPDLAQAHLYACGPAGFVATAAGIATQHQRPFLGEAFTLPERVTGPGERVQIHLVKSRRTVSVPAHEPLLSALEAVGIQPAHGCRRGICNTCACPKASGSTRNLLSQEEQHEPVSGLRLCISSASSDLTLDL